MNFRKNRLQLFLFLGALLCFPGFSWSQEQWDTGPADQDLAAYFRAETKQLSDNCLSDIKTLEDWNKKKTQLRQQLFEMLGLSPLPAKTDLKVEYTGTVEEKDFVVKKLHYQSRPGLYVTGNLYLPKDSKEKHPAILYVCGHGRVSKNGVSYGNKVHYHHHGSWFARNGYVCLTIDTLQLGEIEGIHHGTYREKMWWWLNRGYTPAGVEAWNCIRALDLLQSLPEVDGDRLGVTGRSGGGAYSWWIAALDERIQCAVPVAGITDLENHVVDGCVEGHCDCMFMVNTYRWDYPMVAALVAPRPLLISNTDSDGIFPLDGVYRTYQKVKRIYALNGAAKNVGFHITNGPHKDTQELRVHAFRWFNHHLKKDNSLIEKPSTKFFEPEQLKVFSSLPNTQLNTRIHESFVPKGQVDVPANAKQWEQTARELRETILDKCFRGFPAQASPLEIKIGESKEFTAKDPKNGSITIRRTQVNFTSQSNVPLSMVILHRGEVDSIGKMKMIVIGADDGDTFANLSKASTGDIESAVIQRLSQTNDKSVKTISGILDQDENAIVLFTPRGVGINRWNPNLRYQTQARRRFYLLGQTVDAMRVYDIMRAAQVLRKLCNDQPEIFLNAKGAMAINATYAAMLDEKTDRLELVEPTSSHRDGPVFLNISRILDVPHAIAIAAEFFDPDSNRRSRGIRICDQGQSGQRRRAKDSDQPLTLENGFVQEIRVATAQFENRDADKDFNLSRIEQLTRIAAEQGAQIVSFHEGCIPAYTWVQPLTISQLQSVAEPVPDGPSVKRLIQLARKFSTVIMAGLFELDNDKVYNCYVTVSPEGFITKFRKLHPFVNPNLSPGNEYRVIDLLGWRIGFLICYDNNLPENVRITSMMGADIVFMPHVTCGLPSTMPGRGVIDRHLWENRHKDPVRLRQEFRGPKGREWLMRWLPARAWENGVYAVFSNPIGWDYDTVKPGLAMVLDPFGEVLCESHSLEDDVIVATLTPDKLDLASGRRYRRARRPELYEKLVEPQESITEPGWDREEAKEK